MLKATLRSILSRKLRLLLSGIAVVLGVMAVSGALIVTSTLSDSFDALFATINKDVDVQVTGPQHVSGGRREGQPFTEPVPSDVVAKVAAVPGVKKATGRVSVDGARVIGPDGKVIVLQGPPRTGSAWQGEHGLIELRAGRGPQEPTEVAINGRLAKQGGFDVGDRIQVLTLEPKKTFTVSGIFGYSGGRDSLGGEMEVSFTEPVAQKLMLGREGVYSAIDVQADAGVSPAELRDDIKAALGDGYTVRTGEQVAHDQSAVTKSFLDVVRQILLGFAGVALLVGIFLILNTFSILVAQRTRELALFRALGASRGQIVSSVLVEAAVIGLVASTLGLGAGFGVAALLKQVMKAQSGAQLPGEGLVVPPTAIIVAYVVGIGVTTVAALLPALRASRVAPIAAMRDSATPDRPLTTLTVAGAVPAAAGVAAVAWALLGDPGDWTVWALLAGVLLVLTGVVLLTPAVSRPAVSLLGRAVSWSMPGKLGRRNAARNPRRTAITATALMIGIALVTGVGVLANSLKASIAQIVDQDVDAELIIAGDVGGRIPATYDPAVIDRIRTIPGVARAEAVYVDSAQIGQDVVTLEGGDAAALARVFRLKPLAGELRTLKKGEIAVDDAFAGDHHVSVGGILRLATHRGGTRAFTVVAVYERTRLLPGPLVSAEDARAVFRTPEASQGYVALAAGADAAAIKHQVDTLLADDPEVSVNDRSDFAAQQAGQVDTFLVMLYILIGLALIIAVLGIVNTLALSILERTRELGLLRAVGMRRSQVVQMVTVESVVISVFGALIGMLVGSGLGAAVTRALKDQGIPELAVPWSSLLVFLALAVVVGLVAAVIPAVRAAQINVLHAISYE